MMTYIDPLVAQRDQKAPPASTARLHRPHTYIRELGENGTEIHPDADRERKSGLRQASADRKWPE